MALLPEGIVAVLENPQSTGKGWRGGRNRVPITDILSDPDEAATLCTSRRFEVALVDAAAALQVLSIKRALPALCDSPHVSVRNAVERALLQLRAEKGCGASPSPKTFHGLVAHDAQSETAILELSLGGMPMSVALDADLDPVLRGQLLRAAADGGGGALVRGVRRRVRGARGKAGGADQATGRGAARRLSNVGGRRRTAQDGVRTRRGGGGPGRERLQALASPLRRRRGPRRRTSAQVQRSQATRSPVPSPPNICQVMAGTVTARAVGEEPG